LETAVRQTKAFTNRKSILDEAAGYTLRTIEGTLVILLGGGDKSAQPSDIRKAKERWKESNA
jgi:putative component of toxin-antitoxin plasmid stabilization module